MLVSSLKSSYSINDIMTLSGWVVISSIRNLILISPFLTERSSKNDVIRLIRRMIQINNGAERPDDIDHLGNRRVKTVGELI